MNATERPPRALVGGHKPGAERWSGVTVLAIVPNHVCPVVNLIPELVISRAGTELERWPVDAGLRSG